MSLNYLELRDIENLVNLLLRSQQSKAREALCIRIGVEFYRLSFIRDSSDSDFLIQLIEYLDRIGNKESLCKLCCEELLPIFGKSEIYAPILREIAAKLDCVQEFIHNSNNNTEKKTTLIEKIIKYKSKLHINQVFFLIIFALSLSSAIYLYFPDIWSSGKTEVQVDAKDDPWLAGMPPKSKANDCSIGSYHYSSKSQNNSPAEVKGISFIPGSYLTFTVKGTVTTRIGGPLFNANGSELNPYQSPSGNGSNGISNITDPEGALVGVFIGEEQPSKSKAPNLLSFNEVEKQNYFQPSPKLKQVFFIGDGKTDMGIKQKVIVPIGAKHLYLGIIDWCNWDDNQGSFDVKVTSSK